MLRKVFYSIVLTILLSIINISAFAQITRGAIQGEIYIADNWYWSDEEYYAIFFSQNNGETLHLMYSNTLPPQPGTMIISVPLGDATPGVLYNYGWNELWVSYDYGITWNYIENYGSIGRFASGCKNGEIYKCCVNTQGSIWWSTDYGNNFVEIRDSAKYVLEVGTEPGEVYGLDGLAGIQYFLHYSYDYCSTFTDTPIDTSVAFYSISGKYPEIHRGTEPGEVYLVSWWLYSKYRIYHSFDTGRNFVLKYESADINLFSWGVQYTAGRQPGTFYVIRSTIDQTGYHTLLYIDFSTDYGESFTTYFYDLGDFVGMNDTISKRSLPVISQNKPNPFTTVTTIYLSLPAETKKAYLQIFNLKGELLREEEVTGFNYYTWDGKDERNIKIASGVYLYRIITENSQSQFCKAIYINH